MLSTLLYTWCLSANAQIPAQGPLVSTGELRWIGSTETDIPVDAEGTTTDQQAWLDQRLRLGIWAKVKEPWSLSTVWDLATGQLLGDTWAIPGEIDARHRGSHLALTAQGFRPRRAALTMSTEGLQIEAGLVTSNWGLGLVANDGNTDPVFGRADFGDRVLRFRATGISAAQDSARRVFVTGAADLVVEDEIASLSDGQTAFQGVFSALVVDDDRKLGTYFAARTQREADVTRQTQAGILDLFASRAFAVGGSRLTAAFEAAGILGRTSRSTTYSARDMQGVASLGATGEISLTDASDHLEGSLRAAYATGDADPDDEVSHDFSADRDFGAGMVLFDELQGGVEAASYNLVNDPRYAGQGPDGSDAIVTEGTFRRAVFIQPIARYRQGPLDLSGGVMFAFATAPFSQPFYSYRNGGVPYNQHNQPIEGVGLGTEFDWRAAIGMPSDSPVRAQLEIEGGHLVLGPSLKGDGPGLLHLVTATGRVQW